MSDLGVRMELSITRCDRLVNYILQTRRAFARHQYLLAEEPKPASDHYMRAFQHYCVQFHNDACSQQLDKTAQFWHPMRIRWLVFCSEAPIVHRMCGHPGFFTLDRLPKSPESRSKIQPNRPGEPTSLFLQSSPI